MNTFEIAFNEPAIAILKEMCAIAYANNIPSEMIVNSLIQECSGQKSYKRNITKIEHSKLVRWMRIVWAYKPTDEFRTLIEDVLQLRITFPETEVKKGKFLCSHCNNTGCGAFPTGNYVNCSDFYE